MKPDDPAWNNIYLDANGLRFHAVTEGQGPVVLMLHGFPENWFSWRHQLLALADAGFKAVAVDMRGYNMSDRPSRVSDYHIDNLIRDIYEIISALGEQKVHLVAHDWGGAVAWFVAAYHPEKLLSLSELNIPHPKAFQWHLLHNFRQLRRSWYMFAFQIPLLPEIMIRRDADTQFVKTFRGWAHRKEMFPDEVIQAFKEPMMEPGALSAAINYYRALLRDVNSFKRVKSLPQIVVPTQVIWGDDDRSLGSELCDAMQQYFDGHFEIHHIPNCSHWVQHEQPEMVNEFLIDFLKNRT